MAEDSPKINVTECIYSNNTLNVEVELNEAVTDGVIISAVYNNANRLVAVEYKCILKDTAQYSFNLIADEKFKDYSVRVMLWDGFENITSLAPAQEADIEY